MFRFQIVYSQYLYFQLATSEELRYIQVATLFSLFNDTGTNVYKLSWMELAYQNIEIHFC